MISSNFIFILVFYLQEITNFLLFIHLKFYLKLNNRFKK